MIIYYPICGSGGGDGTSEPPITEHNLLQNIQGGLPTERYHLSYAQYYANMHIKKFVVNVLNNEFGIFVKTKYPMFFGRNKEFVDIYLPNSGQFVDKNNWDFETNQNSLGTRTHHQNGYGLSDTIKFNNNVSLPPTVEVQYYEIESAVKPYVVFGREDNRAINQRVFKSIIQGNYFINTIRYDEANNMYELRYRRRNSLSSQTLRKYLPDYIEICRSTYSNFWYNDDWQLEIYIRGRNQTMGMTNLSTNYGAWNPIYVTTGKKISVKPKEFLSYDIKRNNMFIKMRNLTYNIITQPTLLKRLRVIPYTTAYGYVEVEGDAGWANALILWSVEN